LELGNLFVFVLKRWEVGEGRGMLLEVSIVISLTVIKKAKGA